MTMSNSFDDVNSSVKTERVNRPSPAQVKAIVDFIELHPKMNQVLKPGMNSSSLQELWSELSDTVNSIPGTRKTTQAWIKYWFDKKRKLIIKNKQIEKGELDYSLTPIERQILKFCQIKNKAKKKEMKKEPCDEEESSMDDNFLKDESLQNGDIKVTPTAQEEKTFNIMDTMIDAMSKQATALSQMAQASLTHSKAMQQIAEASHKQALAVDRLSTSFEGICGSVYELRNAMMGINYTIKGYSANLQNRQNSHLFS